MAAFTSKATGNWSATGQTTWNEVGTPGSGDTVSIGAHTITVDVNTTIGTSPNDTTTNVISLANASSRLTIAAAVTLTVKGNITWVNGAQATLNAGAALTFDNSGSGGSPVYKIGGAGINTLTCNGSSGSHCAISAISGQTFSLNGTNFTTLSCDYTDISRMGASSTRTFGSFVFRHCTFTACGLLTLNDNASAALSCTVTDCIFQNSTGSLGCLKVDIEGTVSSSTRLIQRNISDLYVNYALSIGFTITDNCFLGGLIGVTNGGSWVKCRHNFSVSDSTLNGGNGAVLPSSFERNYFVVSNLVGNPHFVSPYALGTDNTGAQNIFESQTPDLVDIGDCFMIVASSQSGGARFIAKNNLVLQSGGVSSNAAASGTVCTYLSASAAALGEWYRNTANVNNTAVGGIGIRGAFAFSEGNTGTAGHIAALKSNLVWGSSSSQGYLGERVTGNVKDIITAAGADYNWTYNTSSGDNQRGYEDRAASNTIWTAGDAVAASVDTHQGSGDPQFYDSARNVAKWCFARGYGAQTYAAGVTAIQADLTRIADLVAYIFEGFRPGNASCRNAAHDGGCVGAANYYKPTRTTTNVTAHRAVLTKFGL